MKWRSVWARNERIAVQALLENLRRLVWLTALLVPLSLLHVASSWNDHTSVSPAGGGLTLRSLGQARPALSSGPSTGAEADTARLDGARWREAVVLVHLVMAANLALVGALIGWTRRQPRLRRGWQEVLEIWGLGSALVFTIAVASIDQWIGTSITSFLIGCVLVGALFLLRPQRAAVMYGLAFLGYAWALGLTQVDTAQLTSNRVDGLIACGLGFVVSLMIWRKHVLKETLAAELQSCRLQLQARTTEMQQQAVRDPLTQVWNRVEMLRQVQRELMRAQRQGGETCLVLVELDGLRSVQERWGVAVTERLLTAVAHLLIEGLRATDEVGRMTHESFAILLPQTTQEEARVLAERLLLAIGRIKLAMPEGSATPGACMAVSAQPGRALVPVPQQCERLYAAAEQALGQARLQGRGAVGVAPPNTVQG
ncbi:GGDEF domain-containing protein [Sphaerotilus mobilis]|uniref:GGDEF domain-containing protein n=1 Tax=Sphaerotilus mobilis TaxID=47994 RepID=UPI00102D1E10|nr:GGDEF domain-containing protein [Sphaerotilus mobilis]